MDMYNCIDLLNRWLRIANHYSRHAIARERGVYTVEELKVIRG